MFKYTCSIDGCKNLEAARGWCQMHYRRWQKEGTPGEALPRLLDRREHFWEFVNKNGPVQPHCPNLGPCWIWTASGFSKNYGKVSVKGKTVGAHRVAWELGVGPIPNGLYVLHHCDNPPCVNYTQHLFLGTHTDNMRDAAAKGRLSRRKTKSDI